MQCHMRVRSCKLKKLKKGREQLGTPAVEAVVTLNTVYHSQKGNYCKATFQEYMYNTEREPNTNTSTVKDLTSTGTWAPLT